jgi:superoxide reductase
VKVGSVAHPMEEKHYIEFIQVMAGPMTYTAFLKPGQAPEATFPNLSGPITVREYCNLHGLWKTEG